MFQVSLLAVIYFIFYAICFLFLSDHYFKSLVVVRGIEERDNPFLIGGLMRENLYLVVIVRLEWKMFWMFSLVLKTFINIVLLKFVVSVF